MEAVGGANGGCGRGQWRLWAGLMDAVGGANSRT